MKRTVSILLAALLLLTMCPILTAQATTAVGEHTHKWVVTDNIEATCTQPGKVYEYCSICQADRERTIPAKGHHYPPEKWETRQEPTCTEPGREKNKCSRCGYEWRREIPALGHDWSDWYVVKAAKPDEPGLEERKCNRCGITEQQPFYAGESEASVFLNAYIPSPQPTYGEGENIPYVLEVTNNSDMPLYIQWIYYYLPSGVNGYVSSTYHVPIAAHETLYFYDMTHQVTKDDLDVFSPDYPVRFTVDAFKSEGDYGKFGNKVENNGWVQATAHIGELVEESGGELTLTKSVANTPEKGYFAEGEEITFTITIKNTGKVPLYDVEVVDYPSGWTGWETDYYTVSKIAELAPNDGASYSVTYTVTYEDCEAGSYTNLVQAIGYTQKEHGKDYDVHTFAEAYADTGFDEDIGDMELVVRKTIKGVSEDDAWPSYTEGDIITFCIDVGNAQGYPLYEVTITDEDSNGKSVVLGTFPVFEGHQSEHYEITHEVTYEECMAGSYTNTAIGTWFSDEAHGDSEEANMIDDSVELELWYEQGDMEMWIEKTEISTPANGSYYTEGETIYYKIDAWNCQGYPLYNVEIWDVPYDADGMRLGEYAEFGPHQSVTFEYQHEVTAEDCAEGKFINGAVVGWQSESGLGEDSEMNWMEATDVESPCGKAEGVVITKKVISAPANGKYYVEGEEIQYEVRVNNYTGNTMHDTWLHDTMTPDDKLNPTGGYGDFTGFADVTYSYKVTLADALMGTVINTAWVEWRDEEGNPYSRYSETIVTLTGIELEPGEVVFTKSVLNAPANGEYYVEGETVHYAVTITNNTGKTLLDVELSDPVKGSNEDAIIDLIPEFEDGASATYDVYHKLTAEEVSGSFFVNVATAVYWMTDDDALTQYELHASCEIPTGDIEETPDVELIKAEVSAPLNGSFYQKDEVVTYSIVFVNNNDYPLYNVSLYDDLFSYTTPISTFPVVGAHESTAAVTFSYVVQDIDVVRTWIDNQAFAEYYLEVGDEDWGAYSNVVIVLTGVEEDDELVLDYDFTKKVVSTSTNEGYYAENETVAYLITLVNNTDYPMYVNGTYDRCYNSNGDLYNGYLTGGSGICAPHDSFSVPFSYKVTKADVAAGYITNYADMEINVVDDRGNQYCFYVWDEVTVKTGEGPIDRPYPAVVKYVTNMPLKGYYEKDEDIEYDVWVYNFTGRPFDMAEGYDILLPDTGFYATSLGTIKDGECVKFHVVYTVTDADVSLKSVYNIAWVTMHDVRYDELVTIYSNEVIVPTDGTTPPHKGARTVCEYKLTAAGDGAEEYMNVYCSEHESVHAAVAKLISEADTPEKLAQAQKMGLELWQRSLSSEYERLIKASSGDLKAALEKDQITFNAYIAAYKSRLEASGASADEVFKAITDAINDRVCELCYTQGHAPEKRTDVAGEDTPTINRRNTTDCAVSFDASEERYFTKSVNICNRHFPLMNAINRFFAAAGEDEDLLRIAWDKTGAFWKADLEGEYNALMNGADPMTKHFLMTEKAAAIAMAEARKALYEAYYGDETLAAQLAARLLQQTAMSLCER